jgi:hypothetical protein
MSSYSGKTAKEAQIHYDEDLHPAISGVVTVQIKECRKLQILKHAYGNGTNVYVKLSIRTYNKRTRVQKFGGGTPFWGQTFNIPIMVVRNSRHPFNWLKLEVFHFDGTQGHVPAGAVSFHVHDIIQASPVRGSFDLFHGDVYAGEINLQLLFNYGLFGYGHSNQYKPPQTIEGAKFSFASNMQRSLFPRVEPPDDRVDGNGITMAARHVSHPEFIPFDHKVTQLGYGAILDPVETSNNDKDLYKNVVQNMRRLPEMAKTLKRITDRNGRLAFLHQKLLATHQRGEILLDDEDADGPGDSKKVHTRDAFMDHCRPAGYYEQKERATGGGEGSSTSSSRFNSSRVGSHAMQGSGKWGSGRRKSSSHTLFTPRSSALSRMLGRTKPTRSDSPPMLPRMEMVNMLTTPTNRRRSTVGYAQDHQNLQSPVVVPYNPGADNMV